MEGRFAKEGGGGMRWGAEGGGDRYEGGGRNTEDIVEIESMDRMRGGGFLKGGRGGNIAYKTGIFLLT